ncbi:hypothetical protein GCM10025865_21100 [Paraoerskovia sediminicola]|uniref:PAC domain-containing protein n=1 Tax=Paraoerskovia sediminicola TaxID=1138587 RepID=A0ABN6XGS5_9CELL|nr:hypothetical protein GCM10025865_21100 [Paraoerskovia sediminicola]
MADVPTEPVAVPALPTLGLSPVMVGLMDELAQTMFCAKDVDGRYVAVNRVFVMRTNARSRREVLGRTAADLFVPQLAERYAQQDAEVLRSGRPLRNELELIRRLGGTAGWFLTSKHPVHDASGRVTGLVSVSQDLHEADADDATMDSMSRLVAAVAERLDEQLTAPRLAALAGCSVDVLDRRVRRVFSSRRASSCCGPGSTAPPSCSPRGCCPSPTSPPSPASTTSRRSPGRSRD